LGEKDEKSYLFECRSGSHCCLRPGDKRHAGWDFYVQSSADGRADADASAEARCVGEGKQVSYVGSSADKGLRYWYKCE